MCKKLETLAADWGYAEPFDLVEDYMFEGLMPGICLNSDCNYSTEYEPDQDHGWCENCSTNTVQSAALLLGVI